MREQFTLWCGIGPPYLQPCPRGYDGWLLSGLWRSSPLAGGLWLWMILVLSLFHAVVVPSGFRTTVQPHWWMTTWWWKKQNRAQSVTDVGPPWAWWRRWWTSQAAAGWSQPPGNRQCWSRRITARRIAAGMSRDTPTSSGRLGPPRSEERRVGK